MKKLTITKSKTAVFFWLLTFSYMALIFLFSSFEYPDIGDLPEDSDKAIHFFEYAVLSVLFFISLRKSGFIRNVYWLSVILSTIYGITDEYHQSYVPGRFAGIGDVTADFIGSAAGVILLRLGLKD